jgi:hypothetical protein
MRDLTHQVGINWEQVWAKSSAAKKEQLFAVVSAYNVSHKHENLRLLRHASVILSSSITRTTGLNSSNSTSRTSAATATERGASSPPAQYAYLKANSAKRDPSAPRGKRAIAVRKAKTVATKKAATKKAAMKRATASKKGKGKQVVDEDNEDEDASMSDVAGPSGGRGEEEEDDYY